MIYDMSAFQRPGVTMLGCETREIAARWEASIRVRYEEILRYTILEPLEPHIDP